MKDTAVESPQAIMLDLPCRVSLGARGLKATLFENHGRVRDWTVLREGETFAPAENELLIMRARSRGPDRYIEVDLRDGGEIHGPALYDVHRPWTRCMSHLQGDPPPRVPLPLRVLSVLIGLAFFVFCGASEFGQLPAAYATEAWKIAGSFSFLFGAFFAFAVPKI